MTTYTLNYWFKNAELQRVYVNAADRSSLGYIERRQTVRPIDHTDRYERHRWAKGQDEMVTDDRVTCTLPEGAYEALLQQVSAAAEAAGISHEPMKDTDEIGVWLALTNLVTARGFMNDTPKAKKARKAFAAEIKFEW